MGGVSYDDLLDAEVRAFIARTDAFYPPEAVNFSVAEQRRFYDALCREFDVGRPAGVEVRDDTANGVPVRIYKAGEPGATVLYFHGGGFVVGGLDSHDSICAEICAETGYRVVSVDYRLSPEHAHPAHFDDAMTAAAWALDRYEGNLVLAGDSAGGNLAAAVAQAIRGREGAARITGQLLIYPGLGGDMTRGSYVDHAHAPGLTTADVAYYHDIRAGGAAPGADPTFAPLKDRDFSDLPPSIVITAACDPLADDGRVYVDRIRAAGGHAEWINEDGLIHGYLRARNMSAKAKDSFGRIVAGIQCLGQGYWPYD